MQPEARENALKEATRILDLLMKPKLTEEEKDLVVSDSTQNYQEYVNPAILKFRKSVSTDYSFVEWEDEGAVFRDTHGVEFIDCLGGYGIYMLGHRNPKVVEVVQRQLGRYALHSQELVEPLRGYLSKLVAMVTPGDIQYSFICNGGAEAIEMALKLARLATGKKCFISTINAFHGKSMGAVSATGKAVYREPYLPLVPGFTHVKYGCAKAVEQAFESFQVAGETVAGVIVEPIQGEGGIIIPPDDYLPRLREICDRYQACLITDEIQTGMGRTGTFWAVDKYGIVPDILVMGKAFGGGVMPVTAIAARPHLWEKMTRNPWVLGSPTFGGNPLSCSAAIAAIKYTLEWDIPAVAKEKGDYILTRLIEMKQRHPVLVGARGRGLLIGMEFPSDEIGFFISKKMFEERVLIGGTLNNALVCRIEPPAVITYEQINRVLEVLDKVLGMADKL
ncbi:MAG TPA: aminotransferase class III-fold pyridoxal phosphate-dependent enzyme [Firmicutes bacterium]|nr:aminotransferase class III-fold pyridoxal phosphate-dependent enzyme [Bacillota bacterium]